MLLSDQFAGTDTQNWQYQSKYICLIGQTLLKRTFGSNKSRFHSKIGFFLAFHSVFEKNTQKNEFLACMIGNTNYRMFALSNFKRCFVPNLELIKDG
jgi:hypothetical protein